MIVAINSIISILSILSILSTISTFSYSFCRLLDMFRTVFPYVNRLGRLIMDTEKAHSIKHCHLDVINFANPINCSCDGPEGGHKKWVKEQGAKTNQGVTSALTMMEHSVRKEASEMLCESSNRELTKEMLLKTDGQTHEAGTFMQTASGRKLTVKYQKALMEMKVRAWESGSTSGRGQR